MKLIAPKIKGLIEAPHPRDLPMWYRILEHQRAISFHKAKIDRKIRELEEKANDTKKI